MFYKLVDRKLVKEVLKERIIKKERGDSKIEL